MGQVAVFNLFNRGEKMKKLIWIIVVIGFIGVLLIKQYVMTFTSCGETIQATTLEALMMRMESIVAQLKIESTFSYVSRLPHTPITMLVLPKGYATSDSLDDIEKALVEQGLLAKFKLEIFEMLMASDEVYVLWQHPLPEVSAWGVSMDILSYHGRTLRSYVTIPFSQNIISAQDGAAFEGKQWDSWAELLTAYPNPKSVSVQWRGEDTIYILVDYHATDGRYFRWEGTTERPKKITERIVIFQL